MTSTQHVNFVQFACEPGHAPVVRRALGESDELPRVVFDDETEPAIIVDAERLTPLAFPQFVRRTPGASATVRLIERLHMQTGQGRHIKVGGIAKVKWHHASLAV